MSATPRRITRRRFCAGACHAAGGVTAATLAAACGGSPTSPSAAGSNRPASMLSVLSGRFSGSVVQVTADGSALATVGGAALVESVAGVFLVARTDASAFTAVDATCTHEGCRITGAAGDVYVCPCHGSRYTRSGQVLAGPATASLRLHATSFANGVVTIGL